MLPQNMPYYRGPRIKLPSETAITEAHHVQSLLLAITLPSEEDTDEAIYV